MKVSDVVDVFSRKTNRKLIAQNLLRKKQKGERSKRILLNPKTNKATIGNINELSKKTGLSEYKIRKMFKEKNVVEGLVPLTFKNMASQNSFLKNKYKNDNIKLNK